MTYATLEDVQARMLRDLKEDEAVICTALLTDAAVIINAYNEKASEDVKKTVACRMVVRALGDGASSVPIGATQGTVSALGYSQGWTMNTGASGELYLSKLEKKLLGTGEKIGTYSPIEEVTNAGNNSNLI